MDFLNNLLAGFLDGLKVKNPAVWSILAIALTGIFAAVTTGISVGSITVTPGTPMAVAVQVLSFISGLFLQSRTTSFVKKDQ